MDQLVSAISELIPVEDTTISLMENSYAARTLLDILKTGIFTSISNYEEVRLASALRELELGSAIILSRDVISISTILAIMLFTEKPLSLIVLNDRLTNPVLLDSSLFNSTLGIEISYHANFTVIDLLPDITNKEEN
jgi:hypothetical protein